MVVIGTIVIVHMQRNTSIHCKSLEKFPHQLGIKITDLGGREFDIPNQERAARYVNSSRCQRVVHGKIKRSIAHYTAALAQSIGNSLSKRNSGIFYRVVIIDVKIALGHDAHINERMAGKLL